MLIHKIRYLLAKYYWIYRKSSDISKSLTGSLVATAGYDDFYDEYCFDIEDENGNDFCITIFISTNPKIYRFDLKYDEPVVPNISEAIGIIDGIVKILAKKLNTKVEWHVTMLKENIL